MCDCLIVGFNDYSLEKFVEMVRAYGKESGAYKDLNLAIINDGNRSYRALDILSRYHFEDREPAGAAANGMGFFHNVDFIWPTIIVLGSYLKKRGFSCDYVNLFHLEKEKLREKLTRNRVLTLAITTTLYVIPQPILEIIEFVRSIDPNVKIIVGGPYISNQTVAQDTEAIQSLFKFLGADVYVDSTEGEYALTRILRALKAGESLDGIDNIAYKNGDHYVFGPKSIESNPLEENPIDYGLFPTSELGEFVSLRTAKSCPFACSFCGFPQRAGKYKYISVGLIENELNALRNLGVVTTLTFLDDTFNVPKERFKEILRMMIKNQYGFRWNSYFRSDHADEEAIELMARSGCEGVFLGVESGSDAMLQKMNKTARTKDYRKAIPLLKAGGIFTHANLIVGFPGETFETFRETCRFIEEAQPDSFRAQLWYADPVTPIWKKRDELGIKGSGFVWSHDTMDCHIACHLVDRMFLSIRNSVWLPQNGFELWSIFYLQRKGMTVKQIKTFLNCFNAIIREKLVQPDKENVDPVLLQKLRKSCRFDADGKVPEEPDELYSAAEFTVAEEFWVNQWRQEAATPALFEGTGDAPGALASKYFKINFDVLHGLLSGNSPDIHTAMLAAYAILLVRWKFRKSVRILADFGKGPVIPLAIETGDKPVLLEIIRQLDQKMPTAQRYAPYAPGVLTDKYHFNGLGTGDLRLECGYLVSAATDRNSGLKSGLRLILDIMEVGRTLRARFLYDRNWISTADVNELASSLEMILQEESGGGVQSEAQSVRTKAGIVVQGGTFRF